MSGRRCKNATFGLGGTAEWAPFRPESISGGVSSSCPIRPGKPCLAAFLGLQTGLQRGTRPRHAFRATAVYPLSEEKLERVAPFGRQFVATPHLYKPTYFRETLLFVTKGVRCRDKDEEG